MIIDLRELKKKSEALQIQKDFTVEELQFGNVLFSLDGPLHSSLRVSISDDDRVKVRGRILGRLEVTCCLCARSFPVEIEKDFQLEYEPDPKLPLDGEEIELAYEELDVGFYRNEELDLAAVLSEQVVLEMPMQPRCREDCKGLCDQCGADLNEGPCGCEKSMVDPRLSVLADIKKKFVN